MSIEVPRGDSGDGVDNEDDNPFLAFSHTRRYARPHTPPPRSADTGSVAARARPARPLTPYPASSHASLPVFPAHASSSGLSLPRSSPPWRTNFQAAGVCDVKEGDGSRGGGDSSGSGRYSDADEDSEVNAHPHCHVDDRRRAHNMWGHGYSEQFQNDDGEHRGDRVFGCGDENIEYGHPRYRPGLGECADYGLYGGHANPDHGIDDAEHEEYNGHDEYGEYQHEYFDRGRRPGHGALRHGERKQYHNEAYPEYADPSPRDDRAGRGYTAHAQDENAIEQRLGWGADPWGFHNTHRLLRGRAVEAWTPNEVNHARVPSVSPISFSPTPPPRSQATPHSTPFRSPARVSPRYTPPKPRRRASKRPIWRGERVLAAMRAGIPLPNPDDDADSGDTGDNASSGADEPTTLTSTTPEPLSPTRAAARDARLAHFALVDTYALHVEVYRKTHCSSHGSSD